MTNRGISSALIAGVALAGVLAVGGCSSGSAPTTLPSLASTTPAASTSPESVEAQVEAAVRHYFDVVNQALISGDTSELKSLSAPACGCRTLVQFIESTFRSGRHPDGAKFVVTSVRVHDIRAQTAAAEVAITVPAYKDLDKSGTPVQTYAEHRGRQDLSLVEQDSKWVITNGVLLD